MPTYNPHTDTTSIEKYQFLHHFLPHPETKRRAKLLQHQALLTYMFVLVFFLGIFRLIPTVAPGVLGYASDINVTDLLNDTNKIRNEHGLSSLTINSDLSKAAKAKAEHMFKHDYWAHIAPDGTTPWDFILGVNYDYSYAGENLAKNFTRSDDVVQAWYDSPSHRDNLLSPNYDEIGFAVVNGVLEGYETTLVVQMFGRPRSAVKVGVVNDDNVLVAKEAVPAEQVNEPVVPVVQPTENEVIVPADKPVDLDIVPADTNYEIAPVIDVTTASKSIAFVVASFLVTLLLLDIWYSKKKSIPKISGNALAHVIFLVIMFMGVWFALSPGIIL